MSTLRCSLRIPAAACLVPYHDSTKLGSSDFGRQCEGAMYSRFAAPCPIRSPAGRLPCRTRPRAPGAAPSHPATLQGTRQLQPQQHAHSLHSHTAQRHQPPSPPCSMLPGPYANHTDAVYTSTMPPRIHTGTGTSPPCTCGARHQDSPNAPTAAAQARYAAGFTPPNTAPTRRVMWAWMLSKVGGAQGWGGAFR